MRVLRSGRAGGSPSRRLPWWSAALAVSVVGVATQVGGPSARGADALTFSAPAEVVRGDVFDLVGASLPTQGFTVSVDQPRLVTEHIGWGGGTIQLPDHSPSPLQVVDVVPGRIRVRAPLRIDGLLSAEEGGIYAGNPKPGLRVVSPEGTWLPDAPVSVARPTVTAVLPATAAPGQVVTLVGAAMGVPPQGAEIPWGVTVGGRRAEVLTWSSDAVTARLHPRTPRGLVGVKIDGAELAGGVVVDGSPVSKRAAKRPALRLREGGRRFRSLRIRTARRDDAAGGLVVEATRSRVTYKRRVEYYDCFLFACRRRIVSVPVRSWKAFRLVLPVDLDQHTAPFTIRAADLADPASALLSLASTGRKPSDPLPERPLADWAVHFHELDADHAVATFSAPGGIDGSFVVRFR